MQLSYMRTVLENVVRGKYLAVTIINDLKCTYNTPMNNICTKKKGHMASWGVTTLHAHGEIKAMAFKGLVTPVLEYASAAWQTNEKLSKMH